MVKHAWAIYPAVIELAHDDEIVNRVTSTLKSI